MGHPTMQENDTAKLTPTSDSLLSSSYNNRNNRENSSQIIRRFIQKQFLKQDSIGTYIM